MAEQQSTLTGTTGKRKRTRRNYQKEIAGIESYCSATIDVLQSMPTTDFGAGQIAFAENILKKLGGSNGRS